LPGWSVFTSPHTVAIHGREVSFHRALLATGARSDASGIAGLAETGFATPETLHTIEQLPHRVAVLGSGARACELALALRQLGCEVYLVADDSDFLHSDEPVASLAVRHALDASGIKLHLGWSCQGAESAGRAKAVLIARNGEQRKLMVDQIVAAFPTRANVERLGLEAAGIRVVDRGGAPVIRVDARLASSNPRVFAVGAACAGDRCDEALERMCLVAVQNAVGVARHRFDPQLAPRTTATVPRVAQIGITAGEAKTTGVAIESWLVPFGPRPEAPRRLNALAPDEVDLAAAVGEFGIVHTPSEQSDRILGATFVGQHAAEALAIVSLLMAEELPLTTLARTPTIANSYASALAGLGAIAGRDGRPAGRRRGRSSR
jgi:pyruvate/2-oxoglutarate dehydrogenase complex dihydrolipoamide dehydrogenase (E3) component